MKKKKLKNIEKSFYNKILFIKETARFKFKTTRKFKYLRFIYVFTTHVSDVNC